MTDEKKIFFNYKVVLLSSSHSKLYNFILNLRKCMYVYILSVFQCTIHQKRTKRSMSVTLLPIIKQHNFIKQVFLHLEQFSKVFHMFPDTTQSVLCLAGRYGLSLFSSAPETLSSPLEEA